MSLTESLREAVAADVEPDNHLVTGWKILIDDEYLLLQFLLSGTKSKFFVLTKAKAQDLAAELKAKSAPIQIP